MWGLNNVLTHSIAYGMGEEEEKAKAEKEKKASSNWHTGKPTEDGEYVVLCQYRKDDGKLRTYKTVFEFKNGEWTILPVLEGILDNMNSLHGMGRRLSHTRRTHEISQKMLHDNESHADVAWDAFPV